MGKYTIFYLFENPRRECQAKNFTTNVPKILDLKSSSEQIFSRKLSLGAPVEYGYYSVFALQCPYKIIAKKKSKIVEFSHIRFGETSENFVGCYKNMNSLLTSTDRLMKH